MDVGFVNLKAQYQAIKGEIDDAIGAVLEDTDFVLGKSLNRFETDFAAYCKTKCAVGVGTGTAALHLALLAIGVTKNDEVITVPNSFVATAEAIVHAGATPVFVDIDQETYTIDISKIEAAITDRTRAILPVHLYGQCADMEPILEIAKEHGLRVVEDACQAHGAEYRGKPAGSMGDAGCFSFYPGKNLGAYGEGGAITTNDASIAKKIEILRNHGQTTRYVHEKIGYNSRLDGIQAAVLYVKLRHIDRWNNMRRQNAVLYDRLLENSGVETPQEASYGKHVYHLYVVRTQKRDSLVKVLNSRGISTGVHYPTPIHLQKAFSYLNFGVGSFKTAEEYANEVLSLPMYPELSAVEIEYVSTEIKKDR